MDTPRHRRYVRLDFTTLDGEIGRLVDRLDTLLRERTREVRDDRALGTPDLQHQINDCRTRLRDLERLRLRALV